MAFLNYLQAAPFLLCILATSAYADTNISRIRDGLSAAPEGGVKFGHQGNNIWSEYCPDETCEKLVASSRIDKHMFDAMSMMYFGVFSKYIYLKNWDRTHELSHAREIFLKNSSICQFIAGDEFYRCALEWGKKKYNLSLYEIRYDENGRHVTRGSFGVQ